MTTKIKLCGLSRLCDIEAANKLMPEYIGFVFAKKSKRYVTPEHAAQLKRFLSPAVKAVGVFVNESPDAIAALLNSGIIDVAQLHGDEDEGALARLRRITDKPIIKAFRIRAEEDLLAAERCSAEQVLLDSGGGSGTKLDWTLLQNVKRSYFLAGGLDSDNVGKAIDELHPYAVDVSSGIETAGVKDQGKMAAFVAAVRKEG